MIGDPSMKSQERVLIDEETLRHNQECIRQLEQLISLRLRKECNRAVCCHPVC